MDALPPSQQPRRLQPLLTTAAVPHPQAMQPMAQEAVIRHLDELAKSLNTTCRLTAFDSCTRRISFALGIRDRMFLVHVRASRQGDPVFGLLVTWVRIVQQAAFDFFWPHYVKGNTHWDIAVTGNGRVAMKFVFELGGGQHAFNLRPEWFRMTHSAVDGHWHCQVAFDSAAMYTALADRIEQVAADLATATPAIAGEGASLAAQSRRSALLVATHPSVYDLWDMTGLAQQLDSILSL